MFGKGFDTQEQVKGLSRPTQNIDRFLSQKSSASKGQVTVASIADINSSSERGIIPRCITDLFNKIRQDEIGVSVYCSFVQIYNEKLFDLLQDPGQKNPLAIREDKMQGIYVEGLSEYVVQNEYDCLRLLKRGERNRITRQTKMNIQSSRSHTIFQFLLESEKIDGKGMIKRSKLNLGDLAGSEKIDKDEDMKSRHLLELRNINQSLTTLGKVIMTLAKGDYMANKTGSNQLSKQKTNQPYIAFRESKLTRLLQDSIGGNCMTYLIATISPTDDCAEESISTMKFADRASLVMQKVKKNEISAKDDALIHKL